jgi:hypothetical protein
MAEDYCCDKCGHVSDKPGNCCGQPMKKRE